MVLIVKISKFVLIKILLLQIPDFTKADAGFAGL